MSAPIRIPVPFPLAAVNGMRVPIQIQLPFPGGIQMPNIQFQVQQTPQVTAKPISLPRSCLLLTDWCVITTTIVPSVPMFESVCRTVDNTVNDRVRSAIYAEYDQHGDGDVIHNTRYHVAFQNDVAAAMRRIDRYGSYYALCEAFDVGLNANINGRSVAVVMPDTLKPALHNVMMRNRANTNRPDVKFESFGHHMHFRDVLIRYLYPESLDVPHTVVEFNGQPPPPPSRPVPLAVCDNPHCNHAQCHRARRIATKEKRKPPASLRRTKNDDDSLTPDGVQGLTDGVQVLTDGVQDLTEDSTPVMTDDPPVESIAERSVEQVNETHVEQVNETHVEQVVEQVAVLETAEASPVIIKPVVEDPAVRKMDKVAKEVAALRNNPRKKRKFVEDISQSVIAVDLDDNGDPLITWQNVLECSSSGERLRRFLTNILVSVPSVESSSPSSCGISDIISDKLWAGIMTSLKYSDYANNVIAMDVKCREDHFRSSKLITENAAPTQCTRCENELKKLLITNDSVLSSMVTIVLHRCSARYELRRLLMSKDVNFLRNFRFCVENLNKNNGQLPDNPSLLCMASSALHLDDADCRPLESRIVVLGKIKPVVDDNDNLRMVPPQYLEAVERVTGARNKEDIDELELALHDAMTQGVDEKYLKSSRRKLQALKKKREVVNAAKEQEARELEEYMQRQREYREMLENERKLNAERAHNQEEDARKKALHDKSMEWLRQAWEVSEKRKKQPDVLENSEPEPQPSVPTPPPSAPGGVSVSAPEVVDKAPKDVKTKSKRDVVVIGGIALSGKKDSAQSLMMKKSLKIHSSTLRQFPKAKVDNLDDVKDGLNWSWVAKAPVASSSSSADIEEEWMFGPPSAYTFEKDPEQIEAETEEQIEAENEVQIEAENEEQIEAVVGGDEVTYRESIDVDVNDTPVETEATIDVAYRESIVVRENDMIIEKDDNDVVMEMTDNVDRTEDDVLEHSEDDVLEQSMPAVEQSKPKAVKPKKKKQPGTPSKNVLESKPVPAPMERKSERKKTSVPKTQVIGKRGEEETARERQLKAREAFFTLQKKRSGMFDIWTIGVVVMLMAIVFGAVFYVKM